MENAKKAESRFQKCVDFVLAKEGGYVNDKYDAGGETKYGISKATYYYLDIPNLTLDDAKEIYKKDYWLKCKCDTLPEGLDIAVFDTAVNMGVSRANEFLRKVASVSDADKLDIFLRLRIERYHKIVEKNETNKRFLKGWLNRIDHLKKFINESEGI